MEVLDALRKAYKQELGGDGYLDYTMARKIMDSLERYTAEAELEGSTPAEDLRQWATILTNAAGLIEHTQHIDSGE